MEISHRKYSGKICASSRGNTNRIELLSKVELEGAPEKLAID